MSESEAEKPQKEKGDDGQGGITLSFLVRLCYSNSYSRIYLQESNMALKCLILSQEGEELGLPAGIVGGNEAEPDSLPFLVTFGLSSLESVSPNGHTCTGTLIQPNVVLTSARKSIPFSCVSLL